MNENTVSACRAKPKYGLATSCLICGTPVFISHMQERPKICVKCREAVLHVRKQIDKSKDGE